MRIHEIRALSEENMKEELESSYREMMNVRFRLATRQLNDTTQLRKVRRSIARIKTVMKERELMGNPS
jgi:large subunit ribosomal protein L29